jgi:hypothetical protein
MSSRVVRRWSAPVGMVLDESRLPADTNDGSCQASAGLEAMLRSLVAPPADALMRGACHGSDRTSLSRSTLVETFRTSSATSSPPLSGFAASMTPRPRRRCRRPRANDRTGRHRSRDRHARAPVHGRVDDGRHRPNPRTSPAKVAVIGSASPVDVAPARPRHLRPLWSHRTRTGRRCRYAGAASPPVTWVAVPPAIVRGAPPPGHERWFSGGWTGRPD